MRRIYVTILERVDSPGDSPEDVGEVVVLDWDTKEVVRRIITSSEKTVQVGRSRGATGITWHDDKIYVGCRAGLVTIDPETYETSPIPNVEFPGGLHQIKSKGSSLYLTCTEGDYLAIMENDEVVQKIPLITRLEMILHFNSIAWDSKGNQYHLYMGDCSTHRSAHKNPSKIVNHTTNKVVCGNQSHLGRLPHDLCFMDDTRLLFNASANGELKLFNLETKECRTVFKRVPRSDPKGSYRIQGFMRGIAFDEHSGSVFVGTAPGTIYEIDSCNWEEKASVSFNKGIGTAVYDILLDPRDWEWEFFGHPLYFEPEHFEPRPEKPSPEKPLPLSRWARFLGWFKRRNSSV